MIQLRIFISLLLSVWSLSIFAEQHALVVGIDQYQHTQITNLRGAVNDALLLRDALRNAQVQLPDKRVLLDADATRTAFLRAWRDMLRQATPGDTLIFTFSGHGGQLADIIPLGEADQYDEMLIFHEFEPANPLSGSFTDDEMYQLLTEASMDYNVVIVVDACHSSGTVRSLEQPVGRIRNIGPYQVPNIVRSFTFSTQTEQETLPPNVTQITAVNDDRLKVLETTIEKQWHGALSWAFVQALRGKADGNQNGFLERSELDRFLREKVRAQMNNSQTPKVLPDTDMRVIKLPSQYDCETPFTPSNLPDIVIAIENANVHRGLKPNIVMSNPNTTIPRGLKHVQIVDTYQPFDLLFEVNNRQTVIFNNTGDKITTLSRNALNLWQRVIDKERLLQFLATQFNMCHQPIRITLREGDKIHHKGQVRHFSIALDHLPKGFNALTLFNLAGNGKLQFLYPLKKYGDKLRIRQFPYHLPPMQVAPPFGGDHLIAVLCQKPAKGLHRLLTNSHEKPTLPTPEPILSHLRNNTCQVGQYAFFSSE